MSCLKVPQGCRHLQQLKGKRVLMKYSEHWEFHKIFFSSHKYNLLSSSGYPTTAYKIFHIGVSW